MKTRITLLFLFISTLVFSGSTKTDSLLKALKASPEDTSRAEILDKLAREYNISSDPRGLEFAQQQMALSEKLNYPQGLAKACYNMGYFYDYASDYPNAKEYYRKAYDRMMKIGMKKDAAMSLTGLGTVYYLSGDYDKSLDYLLQSLKLAEEIQNRKLIASAYVGLGNVYSYLGKEDNSLEYYSKALAIQEAIGERRGASSSVANMAIIYTNRGDYDKAIEYHLRSLKIDEALGYTVGVAQTLTNIGVAYYYKKDFAQCLDYFVRSLELYQKAGELRGVANTTKNIGSVYVEHNEYAKGLDYYSRGLATARSVGARDIVQNCYRDISDAYSKMKDFRQAYEYSKKYALLKDSLLNEESSRQIAEMQTKYETEKKEQQIVLLNKDKELQAGELNRQRIIIWSVIAGLLIVLVLSAFIFKERRKSEKLLLNILPAETAKELKASGKAKARQYDSVTVMFTDFKGFTSIAEKLPAEELVAELDQLFRNFDRIISKYRIEKIKTIGDAYMCASGLPSAHADHAEEVIKAALEIQEWMRVPRQPGVNWQLRVGIHTGPVTAGVVGDKKFAYDIWGDTVNTASRMESSGEPGKVNVSENTYEQVAAALKDNRWKAIGRGKIAAKNKGEIEMFFIERS